MESVGVKELADSLSRILKRVERGEVIRVLRHGKDILELRPIKKNIEQDLLDRLRNKHLLDGGTGKTGPVKTVRNLTPEMPISDMISEDRR